MYAEALQTVFAAEQLRDQEIDRRRQGVLTESALRHENVLFELSRGIGRSTSSQVFVPADLNRSTGGRILTPFAHENTASILLPASLPSREEQIIVASTKIVTHISH